MVVSTGSSAESTRIRGGVVLSDFPARPPGRRVSRRRFLQQAGIAAVGVPSMAAILAACARPGIEALSPAAKNIIEEPSRPDHAQLLPLWEDPIPTDTPIERNTTLQIYNWADYLWPKFFREFESKYSDYNVKVELTTFNDISEGIQKISSGQVSADVFFPDPSWTSRLAIAKLIRPLNHELIPNLTKNYWKEFQDPFYDEKWRYTVPYTIYTTGIAYRRDHISDATVRSYDNPYDILWDPKYAGKVTLYDDYRETIGMALLRNGITDVNTANGADIAQAKDDILDLISRTNAQLTINGIYIKMAQDEFWVGSSWSGDVVAAAQYYLPKGVSPSVLGYWYPKGGGGMIGNDTLTIPATGKNPRLAHEFLNFMLDKNVSFQNFVGFNGYQTPMTSIKPDALVPQYIPSNLSETVVQPNYFDKGRFLLALTPQANGLWNAAWDEIKSGG
jgi:spermidine/putrescine transport system substrate-binding protein